MTEEKDILRLIKLQNKKKNKYGISNERIWEQNIGTNAINLPFAINNRDRVLLAEHAVLYTDNRAILLDETIKKNRKIDKNKKVKIYKYINDDLEKLLTKVYDKINFMKNEDRELYKFNSLGLQKTSKCFFQTNRPKTSKIEFHSFGEPLVKTPTKNLGKISSKKSIKNINSISFNFDEKNSLDNKLLSSRNYELNRKYTNENTKETNANTNFLKNRRSLMSALNKSRKSNISTHNNQSRLAKSTTNKKIFFPIDLYENKGEERFRNLIDLDLEKLYSTTKKKKLNLSRINEIYRVQMNKSLKTFDPERHLKELNKIQLNNIQVRKSMEKVKGKVNKKLDDRCQGLFYKKEYLRIKKENDIYKKKKSKEKKPDPDIIPFNIRFKDDEQHKDVKVFDTGYKKRAFYDYYANCERIQKSKNNDLLEFGANLLFGHMNSKDHELLLESLDELFGALEIPPIMKYIDEIKNEKINRDENVKKERFKKYFPVFTESEKIIQEMEKRKIIKEKKFDENINILDKIHETKKLIELAEKDKHIPIKIDNNNDN